jgi:pyridoxal phosphate phosphatase PHOSPHO2
MSEPIKKCLVAFDFDHTVVEDNTDVVVQELANSGPMPTVVNAYKAKGWTTFMQQVFKYHHCNGIKADHYYDKLSSMPFVPGFNEMLKILGGRYRDCVEMIIVSDSNTVFIDHILKSHGLRDLFSSVITNPAHFDADGMLSMSPYENQEHCDLSAANICKGDAVEEYVWRRKEDDNVEFSFVAYAGDGSNDLCPMVRLGENSLLFPRKECRILKCLENYTKEGGVVRGEVVPWEQGSDIVEAILRRMREEGLIRKEE